MRERSWLLTRICLWMLLFLLICGPRLKLIDIHLLAVMVLGLIGVYFLAMRLKIPKWLLLILCSLCVVFVYSLIAASIYQFKDLDLPTLILKLAVGLLAVYSITILYKMEYRLQDYRDILMRHVCQIIFINAIFVILFILVTPFRNFVGEYWVVYDHWVQGGYRAVDLSLGGGVPATFMFVMGFYIVFIRGGNLKIGSLNRLLLSFSFIAAAVLSARTSFILLLVGFFVLFVFWVLWTVYSKKINTRSGKDVFVLSASFIIFSFLIIYIELVPENVARWAFEAFLVEGRYIATKSTDAIISEMIFFPADPASLIFGSGNLGRSAFGEYIPSDVGYIRLIFAIGVLGSILLWAPLILFVFICIGKYLKSRNSIYMLGMIFSLFVFAINLKELMLLERGSGIIFMIISAMVFVKGSSGKRVNHARP